MDITKEEYLYNVLKKIKMQLRELDYNSKKFISFFDIDLTLIDNKGRANLPVLDFYNFLKKLEITIVLITARMHCEYIISKTIDQLLNIGVTGYYNIIFKKENDTDLYEFKEKNRKYFYDLGYSVLLSVGDNQWDIGKYGGIGILI